MRAGYLGPAGTFSHEALMRAAGDDELVPLPTLHETVLAVHAGTVDRALVPIENALEGSVNPTLDALAFETDDVEIVGELRYPVHHCLVGRERLALKDVRTVVSHPQATAQCARFLREALPQASVAAASSTAEAVRQVAEGLEPAVALGTGLAARLYGAVVLREHVEDDPANETRFVWIARRGAVEPDDAPRWKTALVFWGAGSAGPGWLVRCLAEFASRDVNLVRIESRPRRQRLGEYMFFLDLE
ncbi:MAG: prephenate dehydratase, partial [Actinomycetota bacterium]|nr:prephenate dehydratase [Actinomycetota bacterium]